MNRLPDLGPRGEGYVALQGVLLLAIAAAATLGPAWAGAARLATSAVGLGLLAAGGALLVRGIVDLRENLTPFPRPRDDNRLVEAGAYRLVRHPLYGGGVLGALGIGLVAASPASIGLAIVLATLFDLKSRREEAWLVERHPGYAAYRERTRRLIPWLY